MVDDVNDGATEQLQGGSSFITATLGDEGEEQWDNSAGAHGCVGHEDVRSAAGAAEVASIGGDLVVHYC